MSPRSWLALIGVVAVLLGMLGLRGADPARGCDEYTERLGRPAFEGIRGTAEGTMTDYEAAALLRQGQEGALDAAALGSGDVAASFESLADALGRYRVALVEPGDEAAESIALQRALASTEEACKAAAS